MCKAKCLVIGQLYNLAVFYTYYGTTVGMYVAKNGDPPIMISYSSMSVPVYVNVLGDPPKRQDNNY